MRLEAGGIEAITRTEFLGSCVLETDAAQPGYMALVPAKAPFTG